MSTQKLSMVAKKMKDLDICMMSTNGPRGVVNTRPMSNNRDVKYSGESFFFSSMDTRKVNDIKRSASVSLSFTGSGGSYIIVTGKARLIKDKTMWEKHWDKSLNQWFKKRHRYAWPGTHRCEGNTYKILGEIQGRGYQIELTDAMTT